MSDADGSTATEVPEGDHTFGWEWHISMEDAMEAARTNVGRVVVRCGRAEITEWSSVWKAQPLARFLTRGGHVVWQGWGLGGNHWGDEG